MTINSTTRKTNALVGNGNTATYPFAFKVFTDADFVVKKLEMHKPFALKECKVLIFEPRGVINTGEEKTHLTSEKNLWI